MIVVEWLMEKGVLCGTECLTSTRIRALNRTGMMLLFVMRGILSRQHVYLNPITRCYLASNAGVELLNLRVGTDTRMRLT